MTTSPDLRVSHLEAVQHVVNRLAQNSFTIRGWSVTLVSVVFALVATQSGSSHLVLVTLVPAWIFWALDAYYLHKERLYRHLYNAVAKPLSDATAPVVPLFDMSTRDYRQQAGSFWGAAVAVHAAAIPVALTVVVIGFWAAG